MDDDHLPPKTDTNVLFLSVLLNISIADAISIDFLRGEVGCSKQIF